MSAINTPSPHRKRTRLDDSANSFLRLPFNYTVLLFITAVGMWVSEGMWVSDSAIPQGTSFSFSRAGEELLFWIIFVLFFPNLAALILGVISPKVRTRAIIIGLLQLAWVFYMLVMFRHSFSLGIN